MKRLTIIVLISALFSIPSFAQGGYDCIPFGFNNSKEIESFALKTQPHFSFAVINSSEVEKTEIAKQKKFKGSNYRNRSYNPRVSRPIGVNLIYGGPVYFGASASYFVKPDINLKAGGGSSGVFAGMEYHIVGFRNNPWTPFAGVFGTYSFSGYVGLYIPLGFQYIHAKGFSFGFELAFWMRDYIEAASEDQNIELEYLGSGSIRLGYYF